jgi:hypothetical protein
MTEGTVTATVAPTPALASENSQAPGSQRRKPRRKRNAGKKNDSSSQQKGGKGGASKSGSKRSTSGGNSNNSSNPPPPPQIKITIRNIQNSENFGSVKSVLEGLVSKLMDSCVEKKANNQYAIELDQTAVRHLITEEEKIEQRRELMAREKARLEEEKKARLEEEKLNEAKELKNKSEDDGNNPTEDLNDDGDEKGKIEEAKEEEEKQGEEATNEKKDLLNNKLDVILAPKIASNLPTIIARPLYVVPPRKTSRRGERGGTAYVLLIGPKIERKKPTTTSNASSTTNLSEQQDSTVAETVADDESGSVTAPATDGINSTASSKPTPDTTAAPEKCINYPQELAKGRLLLSNTINSLIELAAADSKAQEFAFSGCIVEQSLNGKTWKIFPSNNSRPDRREGTIEGTADYKEWLETKAKQKEELKARPKPVPGGGISTTTTASTTTSGVEIEEDGQAVSSLVQHIRAKMQEAKRKKSQKKKKKEDGNNKVGKLNSSRSSSNKGEAATGQSENEKKKKRNEKKNRKISSGTGAASGKKSDAAVAKKAKRKKKERAKKKEKAKAAGGVTAGSKAPTSLLKPQSSTT